MTDRFERFSLAIFEISRYWHRLASEELEKYDLKGPHAIYLTTLYQHTAGVTKAQLCKLCGKDKADVTRTVAYLAGKGMIAGESGSGYRGLLKLTEFGREAARHVQKRADLAVELAGKDLTEEDREIFYRALESITANLERISQEGLPEE